MALTTLMTVRVDSLNCQRLLNEKEQEKPQRHRGAGEAEG